MQVKLHQLLIPVPWFYMLGQTKMICFFARFSKLTLQKGIRSLIVSRTCNNFKEPFLYDFIILFRMFAFSRLMCSNCSFSTTSITADVFLSWHVCCRASDYENSCFHGGGHIDDQLIKCIWSAAPALGSSKCVLSFFYTKFLHFGISGA